MVMSKLFNREGVQEGWYRPMVVDVTPNGKLIKDVLTFTVMKKESETAPPDH
jgi:cation transport regulator ChaC